jgi:tetratricopeptide (TPR) repeat protein
LQKILLEQTGETIIPPEEIEIKAIWEWNDKGFSLHYLEKYEEALACFDKAIELNPGYAEAWVNKGVTLCSFGRFDEAIACCDKAIKFNPGLSYAHSAKKTILEMLGR